MDKAAVVTGAARRLGREIALGLAKEGVDLMLHFHRSAAAAEQTAEMCQDHGVHAFLSQADLSRADGVEQLFHSVDAALGRVDLLVNSAAILERSDILSVTDEDWQRTIGLNLKGAFFCLQQAAVRMTAGQGGAIVNISDSAAWRAWPRFPLHSISKAGVEMLTQVAAVSLAPRIRVNAVIPGPTLKPEWMSDDRWEKIVSALPQQSKVPPQNVVQAVTFLFRNEYITGHSMRVDAGALLQ